MGTVPLMGYQNDTPTPVQTGRLLDLPQLAEYLGLTERTIKHLVQTKQIPVTRLGRRLWFDVAAINKWVVRNTEDAA